MAKISIFNIGKANAAISDAQAALAPALAKAGISTIAVDGKTVPAAEAPLASQITALIGAQPVVADSQSAAEAIASNDLISKELDAAQAQLALKTTAVETLTRSNADLTSRLSTAEATVQDLTVKNGVMKTERDAAVAEYGKVSEQLTAQKTALAQRCLAVGCLDLIGEDGKPLAKDATDTVKLAAAMKLSHGDLFKAHNGALNAAAAKMGIVFAEIPAGKPQAGSEKKMTATEKCLAAVAKTGGPKVQRD